jgi:hypothetical protein
VNNPFGALFVKTAAAISVATLLTVSAVVEPVDGQAGGTPPPGSKPVPRAADGKPDLSGVWITGALALLIGDEEARAIQRADAAAGRAAPPPREPPPYKPAAEAKRQEYLARRGIDDPMARCFLSGVPRITTRPLPFQIVQMPGQVIILYEAHHAFRIIPTDGRPHPEDQEPSFLGDSVARWDGDTLVVDVIGFNEKTWLAGVGTIHSDKLHVTERYTRDTYETIRYEVTMEDPEVFTKPWHQYETFRLRPNERLREYECIENNEDLLRFEKILQNPSAFGKP